MAGRDPGASGVGTPGAGTRAAGPPRRAVLIDRDGTLNHDRGYVWRFEDFEWIAGVPEALASLKAAGFLLAAVTNQSGVARGLYSAADVEALHRRANEDLARRAGVGIDRWYYCPHLPDAGCPCRKPSPGMLRAAAADLGADLGASFMVGDKTLDVLAGINAGVARSILVRTGYGEGDSSAVPPGTPVADDFPAAAALIIRLAGAA